MLVPMQPPRTTTTSARRGPREVAIVLGGRGGALSGWPRRAASPAAQRIGRRTTAPATCPCAMEGRPRRRLAQARVQVLRTRGDRVLTLNSVRHPELARNTPLTKSFAA